MGVGSFYPVGPSQQTWASRFDSKRLYLLSPLSGLHHCTCKAVVVVYTCDPSIEEADKEIPSFRLVWAYIDPVSKKETYLPLSLLLFYCYDKSSPTKDNLKKEELILVYTSRVDSGVESVMVGKLGIESQSLMQQSGRKRTRFHPHTMSWSGFLLL